MDKVTFLNQIERHFGFQLKNYQLGFYFSSNLYTVATTPRRAGKTFIISLDALETCCTPNKRACIVVSSIAERTSIKTYIADAVRGLDSIRIERMDSENIYFNNGSTLYLGHHSTCFRGHRFNKLIISEPDGVSNIEDLIAVAQGCILSYQDAQIKLIGTHWRGRTNLMAFMLSPYWHKIQATQQDIVDRLTREQLEEIRQEMGEVNYSLEMKNEFTPSVLEEMFTSYTRRN